MNRVILTPAVLPPSALAELKQWLGVTTTRDDGPLSALLASALETCEAFTGSMPLAAQCEEVLPAEAGWHALSTRPVQAITAIDGLGPDPIGTGTGSSSASERFPLPAGTAEIDLGADGGGRVRLSLPPDPTRSIVRIAVRFTAGLADDWDHLPDGLRHGMIRLAAHQHRERESEGAAALPPASVAALWRPWRRMRLR